MRKRKREYHHQISCLTPQAPPSLILLLCLHNRLLSSDTIVKNTHGAQHPWFTTAMADCLEVIIEHLYASYRPFKQARAITPLLHNSPVASETFSTGFHFTKAQSARALEAIENTDAAQSLQNRHP